MGLFWACALSLVFAAPGCAQESDVRLVSLSSHTFVFERIGSLTSMRCAKKDDSEDCRWLEALDPEPQVDWDAMLEKARVQARRKKRVDKSDVLAAQMFIDQYGGPWILTLRRGLDPRAPNALEPFVADIAPDFPGYKIVVAGAKVLSTDILRRFEDWERARKELGLPEPGQEKKKRKLTDWL